MRVRCLLIQKSPRGRFVTSPLQKWFRCGANCNVVSLNEVQQIIKVDGASLANLKRLIGITNMIPTNENSIAFQILKFNKGRAEEKYVQGVTQLSITDQVRKVSVKLVISILGLLIALLFDSEFQGRRR